MTDDWSEEKNKRKNNHSQNLYKYKNFGNNI